MSRAFIIFLFLSTTCYADIRSTTGQIKFDVQMDNQVEMTLNATGLGIGITPSTNLHVEGNAILNQLFVGGSSGSSNLNVNGTMGFSLQTISSNVTLSGNSLVFVDSSNGNITLRLPYAGNVSGRIYHIKKTSLLNSVWISGAGNLIDDTNPIELTDSTSGLASVEVLSNGAQWYVIASKDLNITVAADNLIGWWKLDEQTGSLVVDSIAGRNGTLNNPDGDEWVSGLLGGALNLSASDTDDYVSIADDDTFDFDQSESFSISTWIKTSVDSPGPNTKFIYKRSGFPFYTLQLASGYRAQLELYTAAPASVSATGSSNVMDGQWHHLVGGVDRAIGASFIYVDGVLEGTNGAASGNFESASALQIGVSGPENLQGLIEDVRIYNKALSEAEIQAIYDQGQ